MRALSNLCLLALLWITACANPAPSGHHHVLILGDSISMGYFHDLQEILGPGFTVVRPMTKDGKRMENCAGTTKGIKSLDRWLAPNDGRWDVIHFNFGLHDIKRVHPDTGKPSHDPAHQNQANIATYQAQLTAITDRLSETGARLIFATTTPVPEGKVGPYRDPSDAVLYNSAAEKIMHARHIAVDDLFSFALPRLATIQKPTNVHFTNDGSRALAHQVAGSILEALQQP